MHAEHTVTNRLGREKSPYLLQHAANPVAWHAWDDDAFARARAEDKPVFLSIGYATCHWCHVMAHESFEDPEIAGLLNDACVCIKVDREERPDIDHVYMAACQMLTGRGGWPLTAVMTPEGKPFFAATYIPRESRFAMTGMRELVPQIDAAWRQRRSDVVRAAEDITARLREAQERARGGTYRSDLPVRAYEELLRTYDARHGGFGRAPKFPLPHQLVFLLEYFRKTGEEKARDMALHTLRSMRRGGIWDHIGYGFHRYSTDERWLVPHFEKMLYDQALMAHACLEACAVTGGKEWEEMAREILTYVLRDMTAPEGGFRTAEDADSEGREGLFYLWTLDEIEQVLAPGGAAAVAAVFNVRREGNFTPEHGGEGTGYSILHRTGELAAAAASLGMSPDALAGLLEGARAKLFAAREGRIHPLKDDKILTDWNGLMIGAFARAARMFGDAAYADASRRAVSFIREHLLASGGRLLHRWRDGEAAFSANLDDYAFLVWGLLECHEMEGRGDTLTLAAALQETLDGSFWDADRGGYFFTPAETDLLFRPKDAYDGAIPSGNSVSLMNLFRLGLLDGNTKWRERAALLMGAFAGDVPRSPASFTHFLAAADKLTG